MNYNTGNYFCTHYMVENEVLYKYSGLDTATLNSPMVRQTTPGLGYPSALPLRVMDIPEPGRFPLEPTP